MTEREADRSRGHQPILLLCILATGLLLARCGSPAAPDEEPQSAVPQPAMASPSLSPADATAGTQYYVALNEPGASDANSGLLPTHQGDSHGPWATLQHAAAMLVAGDTAYVRAGTYYEASITFAHSGSPGAPITIAAYQDEEVIVDGSRAKGRASGIEIAQGHGHYVLRGLTIRYMPRSGITTDSDTDSAYHDLTIQDCTLYGNGLSGIRLAAVDGFLVENVDAYDNGYYGLDINGSDDGALSAADGQVRHSSFHHHTGKEGHGLAINQGHDIVVAHSTAYHNTIHGFDASDWPKRGIVSYNLVFEGNRSYDNGAAGFSINSDSHHVVYRNNVAWHNGADWAGQGSSSGFLCYEGCWHVEWYNNVSLANSDAGFYVEGKLEQYSTPGDSLLVFKNNIAYNNGRAEWEDRLALVVEGRQWEVISTHNNWAGAHGTDGWVVAIHLVDDDGEIYTAEDINRGALQAGNISTDPLFADPTLPDIRLLPGSPCIDAGVDVGLPYLGRAPDMGAFEFDSGL
jgi:hypothetical protein